MASGKSGICTYRTRSVRSLLSSIVPLSNIVPQKLEKNINLEGKNKALFDIVRTLQKLKEIQAADSNRARTVHNDIKSEKKCKTIKC